MSFAAARPTSSRISREGNSAKGEPSSWFGSQRQHVRGLAGQQFAVCPHLVGLRIDLNLRLVVIEQHVGLDLSVVGIIPVVGQLAGVFLQVKEFAVIGVSVDGELIAICHQRAQIDRRRVVTVLDERVARSRAGRFLGKKPGEDIDLTIANLPIERSGGILADQEVRIEASATFRNR